MSEEVKNPYGDMHLSYDQKEMLRKGQEYRDATPEQKAEMEKELYSEDGDVGPSTLRFIDPKTDKWLSESRLETYKDCLRIDSVSPERLAVAGEYDWTAGWQFGFEAPTWSGLTAENNIIDKKHVFIPCLGRYGMNAIDDLYIEPRYNAQKNSINRSMEDIEKFFDNPDTYTNLNILRNALSGAKKDQGKESNYFCELSDDPKNKANLALDGLYLSFITYGKEFPHMHPSSLIRLLTPSLAFSSDNAYHKRSWLLDSMIINYELPIFDITRGGESTEIIPSGVVKAAPPGEEPYSSDFHNVVAHMFVRMAERFGMFDAKTSEDKSAIKERVMRWQKYILVARANEMLNDPVPLEPSFMNGNTRQNPKALDLAPGHHEIHPITELGAEDKKTLKEYCREHINSGFKAEQDLAQKLVATLSDLKVPEEPTSENSVMNLGFELQDNRGRPVEVQYGEKFHAAMMAEGTKEEKAWAEKIDITDDFDEIMWERYGKY